VAKTRAVPLRLSSSSSPLATMSGAARKLADPAKYHLQPTGFWKKFRDAVVVSPEISSGLPIQGVHRWPPPASRPERYTTPATKGALRMYSLRRRRR
jgi:hypothetical protein